MFNLLKSDLYKLAKSKTFLLGLLACAALTVPIVFVMHIEPGMFQYTSGAGAIVGFLPMNLHLYFVAAFVAIFITSEFHYGTMKNILSRGSGRIVVFFSKLIVCSLAAVLLLLVFMLTIVVAGSILFGYDPDGISTVAGLASIIFFQSLMTVAYTALFTLFSIAIRNLGGAIVTNIMFLAMGGTILAVMGLTNFTIDFGINALSSFTPYPSHIPQGVVIAFAWAVVSVVISVVLFVRQDVK